MIFFPELNLELIIDASAPTKLGSDELVGDNLLLKALLMYHSSHTLRSRFDERITNDLYM